MREGWWIPEGGPLAHWRSEEGGGRPPEPSRKMNLSSWVNVCVSHQESI